MRRSPTLPFCARSLTHARPCSYTFESPFYHVPNSFLRGTDRSNLIPYKSCVATPPLPPPPISGSQCDA